METLFFYMASISTIYFIHYMQKSCAIELGYFGVPTDQLLLTIWLCHCNPYCVNQHNKDCIKHYNLGTCIQKALHAKQNLATIINCIDSRVMR